MSVVPQRYLSSIVPKSDRKDNSFFAKRKSIKFIVGDCAQVPNFMEEMFEMGSTASTARYHNVSAPDVRKNRSEMNVNKTNSTSKFKFVILSGKFVDSSNNGDSGNDSSPERTIKNDEKMKSKFKVEVEQCKGKFLIFI